MVSYSPLLGGSSGPSSSRGLDRLVHYGEPNDPEWLGGSEYMQRWVHSAVSLMGEGDDEATMLFYQLMNWRGRGAMSRRTRGYLGRGRASLAKHRDTAAVRHHVSNVHVIDVSSQSPSQIT